MKSERTSTSNPSEEYPRDRAGSDPDEEFFLLILECDDFWWEEEDRHTLF